MKYPSLSVGEGIIMRLDIPGITPQGGAGGIAGRATVAGSDGMVAWVREAAGLLRGLYRWEVPYNDAFHPGPGRLPCQ